MARQAHAVTLQRWRQLIDSLAGSADEGAEIEQYRARLEEMYNRSVQLAAEQAALEAARQTVTHELNEILEKGRKTATLMRVWLQERHGNRSEKLVAFGIQPFRGRPRKKTSPQG